MWILDNYAEMKSRLSHNYIHLTSHSLQLRVKFMYIYVMWMFWSFLLITSASLSTWNNFIAVYWYWIREHIFFTHHNWDTYSFHIQLLSFIIVYTMMNIYNTPRAQHVSVLLLFTNRRAWKFFQTQSSHKRYNFIR